MMGVVARKAGRCIWHHLGLEHLCPGLIAENCGSETDLAIAMVAGKSSARSQNMSRRATSLGDSCYN